MKLLGRNKDDSEGAGGADDSRKQGSSLDVDATSAARDARPGTAPKGRPTPKRNEASRRRGPVAPAPMTSAEARRRRKELRGPKLSREERKVENITKAHQ